MNNAYLMQEAAEPETAGNSTDPFEEWNFKNDSTPGAVIDGKIIARMPDLGNNKIDLADEQSAVALFRKAFAVLLQKGTRQLVQLPGNKVLFSRLTAVGIIVLVCGFGLMFLDKDKSTGTIENTLAGIAVETTTAQNPKTFNLDVPVVVPPNTENTGTEQTNELTAADTASPTASNPFDVANIVPMQPIPSHINIPPTAAVAPRIEGQYDSPRYDQRQLNRTDTHNRLENVTNSAYGTPAYHTQCFGTDPVPPQYQNTYQYTSYQTYQVPQPGSASTRHNYPNNNNTGQNYPNNTSQNYPPQYQNVPQDTTMPIPVQNAPNTYRYDYAPARRNVY